MASPVRRKSKSQINISPRPVAVIDIGANSIRMTIAEISERGEVTTIDSLIQSVSLGNEVFQNRRISRKTIENAVDILSQYQKSLKDYGIENAEDVRVVATSAAREAGNRLAFTDRIFVATGLDVETIEEAEVNRITYMGIAPQLAAHPELAIGKSIVVEIGGGSTEMLVVRAGNVLQSQSYRLGSVRLLRLVESAQSSGIRKRQLMESHIRRTLSQIGEKVKTEAGVNLVALGGDMRFAARHLLGDWNEDQLAQVPVEELSNFAEEISGLSEATIARQYNASFVDAQTLGPALMAYTLLAEHFQASNLFASTTNLRDGLLHDMAVGGSWTAEFRNQIVRSAMTLGRRFDFDEMHARNVAELAKRLFDQLQDYHKLSSRHEVILYVAALLHEIGLLINVRSNHKHALYVIRHSNLFGLSQSELIKVGLVARYHRRASPQSSHEDYGKLDRHDRVIVAKLASILRLAIALDDTRSGRIREVECTRDGKRLVIQVPGVDDVSLEQIAMKQNANLFREVFGIAVSLRTGK